MKSEQKSMKKRSRNQTYMNDGIFNEFGLIFDSFLDPKSVKNRSENDVEKQCDSRSDWKSQRSPKVKPRRSAAPRFWGHGEGPPYLWGKPLESDLRRGGIPEQDRGADGPGHR